MGSPTCAWTIGFEAIGGRARLSSGPVQGDAPCFDLEISGGASDLHVVTR